MSAGSIPPLSSSGLMPESGPPPAAAAGPHRSRFRRRVERLLVAALLAGLGWFYWWTAHPTGRAIIWQPHEPDYFNLLVDGFLDGHLHLKAEVPPGLIHAENPYDPAKRPPGVAMHDVSYYQGRYYLYFGVGPVVMLFLPFRLLTGLALPNVVAIWTFAFAGLLAGAGAWLRLKSRHYPGSGAVVSLLGILILGLVGCAPILLGRSSFWELPIASGYACAMLAVWCVGGALDSARPARWLAGAAVCLGLAVASRPVYLFGCVALAVPLAWAWRRGRREGAWTWWPGRAWWWQAAAVAGPLAVIGAALALYNHLRFGNPFEFGLKYQLTALYEMKQRHFDLQFIPLNLYLYFLAPAQWGRYFPFFHFIKGVPAPAHYYAWEYVWGAAVNMPVVWLALAAPLGSLGRRPADGGLPGAMGLTALALFFTLAGVLACFNTAAARYTADFMPALALAAALGLLVCERWLRQTRSRAVRRGGRLLWGGALLFSAFFALMISMQVHGIMQSLNPARYHRVARFFNALPAAIERLVGTRHGALELNVRFRRSAGEAVEPLVATGWEFYSDRLLVNYMPDGRIRFFFDHTSRGADVSEAVAIDYDVPHLLRVEFGSLYPPLAHPYFDAIRPGEADRMKRRLRVVLDDRVMLEGYREFYEAAPESVKIGQDPLYRFDPARARFRGEIASVKRLNLEKPSLPGGEFGSVRLRLRFPGGPADRSEPLVTAGAPGQGDAIYVRYLPDNRAVFGVDHWGSSAIEGPPMELDPARLYNLDVRLGSLYPPGGSRERRALLEQVLVRLDDKVALNTVLEPYATDPTRLYVGANSIGFSSCITVFTGQIQKIERVMEGPEQPSDSGPVQLGLWFPAGRPREDEPLVATGRTGDGDVIFVRYLDERTIRFGHDHWGGQLAMSDSVEADAAEPHVVEIDMGSLYPDATVEAGAIAGMLTVKLDDRVVWSRPALFARAAAEEVYYARNGIAASSCAAHFGGALLHVTRAADRDIPSVRP